MISVSKGTNYIKSQALENITGCSEYSTLNPFNIPFGQLVYNKNMEYFNQNNKTYCKTRRGSKLYKDINNFVYGAEDYVYQLDKRYPVYVDDAGTLNYYDEDADTISELKTGLARQEHNFKMIGSQFISALYGCNEVDGVYKVSEEIPEFSFIADSPKINCIELSTISGRMFGASGQKIFYSEIQQLNTDNFDNLETWNITTNFVIPAPDAGEGIKAIKDDGQSMFFFKDTGILCLPNAEQATDDWYFPRLKASVGTLSGKTVRNAKYGNVQGFIYLATDKTLRFIPPRIEINAGVLPSIFDDVANIISTNFQGLLSKVTNIANCNAVYYDNKYILNIPTIGSEIDTTIFIDCEKLMSGSDNYPQPYWYYTNNLNFSHYIVRANTNSLYGFHLQGYISKLMDEDTYIDEVPERLREEEVYKNISLLTPVQVGINLLSAGWRNSRTLSEIYNEMALQGSSIIYVAYSDYYANTYYYPIRGEAYYTINKAWTKIAYRNGRWVAISATAGFMTSTDTKTWTLITAPAGIYNDITSGNNGFVAIGVNSLATSPDGLAWTVQICPTGAWAAITYGNGYYVAVGNNAVMTSSNGVTFNTKSCPLYVWTGVAFGNDKFVAISNDKKMVSSDLGNTWTLSTNPESDIALGITFGKGKFIAVGSSSVSTTTDGNNWELQTCPIGIWTGIASDGEIFVAVASNSSAEPIMTSEDGEAWTLRAGVSGEQFSSIANGSNMFIALSSSGTGRALRIRNVDSLVQPQEAFFVLNGANFFYSPTDVINKKLLYTFKTGDNLFSSVIISKLTTARGLADLIDIGRKSLTRIYKLENGVYKVYDTTTNTGENFLITHNAGYLLKFSKDWSWSGIGDNDIAGHIIDSKIVTGWHKYSDRGQLELVKVYLKWGTDTNNPITFFANGFNLGDSVPQYDQGVEYDIYPNTGSGGYESNNVTNMVIASSENNEMTTPISIRAKGNYFNFGLLDNTKNQRSVFYGIEPIFKVSRQSTINKR